MLRRDWPVSDTGGEDAGMIPVDLTPGVDRCGVYAEMIRISGRNSTLSACPDPPA